MERRVLEQCYTGRRPKPQWLENSPALMPGLDFYFVAFNELTTCRAIGMGVGPIPWTSIQEYADRAELDSDERDNLTYLIRAMDNAYLDWGKKEFEKKHLNQARDHGQKGAPIGGR